MSENGGRGRVTGTRRTHLPSQASNEAEGGTDDHLLHHGRLQTPQELRGREKRKVRQQSFLPPSAQPARQPLDAGIGGRGAPHSGSPRPRPPVAMVSSPGASPGREYAARGGKEKDGNEKERKRGKRDGERTFTAVLAKTCGALITAGVVMIFPLFHSPPFRATGFNLSKKKNLPLSPPTSPGAADESRNPARISHHRPRIGGQAGPSSRMAIAAIAGASLVIAALGRIGLTEHGPGAEPAGNMDSPDIPLRKLKRCEAVLRR